MPCTDVSINSSASSRSLQMRGDGLPAVHKAVSGAGVYGEGGAAQLNHVTTKLSRCRAYPAGKVGAGNREFAEAGLVTSGCCTMNSTGSRWPAA